MPMKLRTLSRAIMRGILDGFRNNRRARDLYTKLNKSTLILIAVDFFLLTLILAFDIYPLKYQAHALLVKGEQPLAFVGYVLRALSWPTYAVLMLLAVSLPYIVYPEWRAHNVAKALVKPGWPLVAAVSMFALFLGHSYLEPGLLVVGDANSHVSRVAHFANAVREGAYPGWSNFFYGGSPVLLFTGPMFHWIAGAIALLAGSPDVAVKITLVTLHFASGAAFDAFARSLGLVRFAAILAALLYVGGYVHLHQILYSGSFPQAMTFAVIPAVLACFRTVVRRPGNLAAIAGLGMLAAVLVLTHQTTAAVVALYLFLLAPAFVATGMLRTRSAVALAVAATFTLLAAAAYMVPILVESEWIVLDRPPIWPVVQLPDGSQLAAYVRWRHAMTGMHTETFVGFVPLALGLAGIWIGVRTIRNDGRVNAASVGFLTALVFAAGPLFVTFPFVKEGVVSLVGICALAGFTLDRIARAPAAVRSLVILLCAVELALLAPLPLNRTDKQFILEAGRALSAQMHQKRIVYVTDEGDRYTVPTAPGAGIVGRLELQKLDGPHNITAPRNHNYIVTTLKWLQKDLNTHAQISPKTRRMLCAYNVGRLHFGYTPEVGAHLDMATTHLPGRGYVHDLECAAPLTVAPRTHTRRPPQEIDVGSLAYADLSDRRMRRVQDLLRSFLAALEGGYRNGVPSLPVRAAVADRPACSARRVTMTAYEVTRDRVKIAFNSASCGWVRLAHPWYPGLTYKKNGEPVEPLQGTLGQAVFPFNAGRTRITIAATPTPIRTATAYVSTATWAGLAALMLLDNVFLGRRRKRAR